MIFGFESKKSILKEKKDAVKGDDAEDVSDGGAKGFSKAWSEAAESFKSSMSSMSDSGTSVFGSLTTSTGTFFKTFWSGLSTLGKVSVVLGAVTTAATIAYKVFDHFYDTVEETKEKAEGFAESISNITSNMPTDSSTLSSLNSEYQELSKGVNELGQNVSLSSDEYERYKEIVAQVSEIMPDMSGQFNSQGEQIGFAQGKLADLNAEYEKYIQNQAKGFLVNGDEDGNTFQDVLNNYGNNSDRGWFDEITSYFKNLFGFSDIDDVATDTMISTFKDLQGKSKAQISMYLDSINETASDEGRAKSIVKSILGSSEEILEMTDSELQQLIASNIESLQNSKDADMSKIVSGLIQTAYSKDSFWELETEMRDDVTTMLSSLNSDVWDSFDWNTKSDTEINKFVESIISSISSNENGIRDAWDNLFKLNINELSADEYISKINEYIDTIGDALGLDEDSKNQFLISLGFDIDTEDNVNKMRSDIEKVLSDGTENLDTLNLSDLQIAAKITANFDENSINWDDLMTEVDISKYLGDISTSVEEVLDSLDLSATDLFGNDKEFTNTVDDYIDKVNELNASLSKYEAGNFSNDDVQKLIKDFPELANQTDNLDSAIINLLGDLRTDMMSNFASQFGKLDSDKDIAALQSFEAAVLELGEVVGDTQFSIDIDTETQNVENLLTAINESASATGLSKTSMDNIQNMYAGLESYDPSTLFEKTEHGIHLNSKALRELQSEYEATKKLNFSEELQNLKQKYNETAYELSLLTEGSAEWNETNLKLENIESEINSVATLASQYEGLTSAYNKWSQAQSTTDEDNMYSTLSDGLEGIKELYDSGRIGTDDFREAVQLMTDTDVSTASIDDLLDIYDQGYKTMKKFFTGNSDGLLNFLNTAKDVSDQLGKDWVKLDKDGNWTFDFGVGGDEELAKAINEMTDLQMSTEEVQILLRALSSYGFDINLDSIFTSFENLQSKIEETESKLKELDVTPVDINVYCNIDEVDSEIDKTKQAIEDTENKKITASYTKEAQTAEIEHYKAELDALIQRKIEAEEPLFMSIDVEDADESVQGVLTLLQQYQKAADETKKLKLAGADASEIKEAQKLADNFAKQIQGLNPEIKAKIGIDEDDDIESIKKKIANDEIEIPTTLDINDSVKNISDSIEDILYIIKHELGLISDEEYDLHFNANVDDEEVNELIPKIESLDDKQIKAIVEVLGTVDVEKLKSAMDLLDDKTVQAIVEALGTGDVEGLIAIIDTLDDKTVQAIAEAFGYSDVEELKESINNMDGKTVQAIAEAIGEKDVDDLRESVDNLDDKTVDAIVETYGEKDVGNLQDKIDGLKGKTVTIWAQIKQTASSLWDKVTGFASVEGTAHAYASGTAQIGSTYSNYHPSIGAYVGGTDWTLPQNEEALVNEIGTESIVRDGKWFLIPGGAHVEQLKKGDIVFSAAQTEELMRTGKVTSGGGHGRVALADGTAYNMINAYSSGGGKIVVSGKVKTKSSSTKKKSSSTKSNSKSNNNQNNANNNAEETKETFDWIERKIKDIERDIENLDQTASATYKSWTTRNKALASEMSNITKEISIQQAAYTRYMKEANSVGLSSKYKKLVQDGKIDISTIKDEDLIEKIQTYQDWYDKAIECKDAVQDLQDQLAELARTKFDNVVQQYEDKLSTIEHEVNVLDSYINQVETSGHIVSRKYYDALISQEKKNISTLKQEYSSLTSALNNAMKTGNIKKGSEEWYAMQQEINGVEEAIIEANTALIEYQNSIRQLKWDAFDRLQDAISNITEESEFLIGVMENSELYDDKGQLTNTGMATMGLHAQDYNVYMAQADKYAEEMKKIDKELAKDPSNLDLIERREELLELQQESILAAEDEKQAIRDMVEEGINIELEALQDLIDKYNESLESAKDLYDYQKNIEEQTKEIASLQKQLTAYQGDTSEENKAKIQQIKVSLEEAQKNLEETEYEHYISEQQKMLDNLYDEYETILNERLDNIDMLISDMIDTVNANSSSINDTLNIEAEKVGYTISDSIHDIWSNEGDATTIISKYGDNFCSQLTSVNNVLNAIAATLGSYVKENDKEATSTIKGTNSSSTNKKNTTTSSTTTKKTSSNNSNSYTKKTIKVGGKINAGSAKIYDYAGDTTGETQYYKNDPIYTVLDEKNGYLKVRHHKLSSGVTGWFKKSDVKAYKTGGLVDYDGLAMVHGGKKPEMVLNSKDTENFINLNDALRRLTKEDSILFSDDWVEKANSLVSNMMPVFDSLTSNDAPSIIPSNTNQSMNNTFYMTFELHDVTNGEDVVNYLIKSDRFENAVKAMTVDRLAGGSKFSKSKYYRNN